MKKKILFMAVFIAFSAFLSIGLVNAYQVEVTCTPKIITTPGGSTTITVSCDKDVSGSITVITPISHTPYTVSITVSAGGSTSKVYPAHFSGDSTEVGEYEVIVLVGNEEFRAAFWVYFEVIPEVPLGTIMATVACFGALATLIKKKRL